MQKNDKTFFLKIYITLFLVMCVIAFGWKVVVNILFLTTGGVLLEDSPYFRGEIAYNRLLSSRGSGDITPLQDSLIIGREADRVELLGDILSARGASTSDILTSYERSLALEDRPRVREKIRLLSSATGGEDPTPSPQPFQTGSTQSGGLGYEEIVQEANERIKDDAENRSTYMPKTADKYILQDSIEYLDYGTERIDW